MFKVLSHLNFEVNQDTPGTCSKTQEFNKEKNLWGQLTFKNVSIKGNPFTQTLTFEDCDHICLVILYILFKYL